MKDLTGQRFGRLVALEPTDERRSGLVVWRCRCDCGRECEVTGTLLTKGNTRSCGCLQSEARRRDLVGKRFGKLVVVEATDKRVRQSVVWRCRCDCGSVVEVPTGMLTMGKKRSCGCLKDGPAGRSVAKDLAGRRFGRLTAVRPVGRRKGYVLWECACDCGNTKLATTSQLTSGKTRSCGCLASGVRIGERAAGEVCDGDGGSEGAGGANGAGALGHAEDLAGRRFGKLVAVRHVGSKMGRSVWECRCDCGALVRVSAASLKSGNTRSCGCLRSGGASALAGKRFGSLVAVDPTGEGSGESALWRCLCDCDTVCVVEAGQLTSHPTAHCTHY